MELSIRTRRVDKSGHESFKTYNQLDLLRMSQEEYSEKLSSQEKMRIIQQLSEKLLLRTDFLAQIKNSADIIEQQTIGINNICDEFEDELF